MTHEQIIVATTDVVAGRETAEVLGLVRGNTIRARHVGSDIGAALKAMTDAREEALMRMLKEAETLGADAVVGVRFATSQIMAGAAEILVYGTAVRLR